MLFVKKPDVPVRSTHTDIIDLFTVLQIFYLKKNYLLHVANVVRFCREAEPVGTVGMDGDTDTGRCRHEQLGKPTEEQRLGSWLLRPGLQA